jgi:FtsZ-binding cell division protein ZapB
VATDIVSHLEKRIDELISFQGRLSAENERLKQTKKALQNDRKRCQRELDNILSKLDHLGEDRR